MPLCIGESATAAFEYHAIDDLTFFLVAPLVTSVAIFLPRWYLRTLIDLQTHDIDYSHQLDRKLPAFDNL